MTYPSNLWPTGCRKFKSIELRGFPNVENVRDHSVLYPEQIAILLLRQYNFRSSGRKMPQKKSRGKMPQKLCGIIYAKKYLKVNLDRFLLNMCTNMYSD